MTNHQRWNSNLTEYELAFGLPSKDFYKIAIIRQPLGQFISAFNFFYGEKGSSKGNSSLGCFLEPYESVYREFFGGEKGAGLKKGQKGIRKYLGDWLKKTEIKNNKKEIYFYQFVKNHTNRALTVQKTTSQVCGDIAIKNKTEVKLS